MDRQSRHVITVQRRAQGPHAWAEPDGLLAAAPLEYKKHNPWRARAPLPIKASHGNHFSPTVVDAQDTFQRQVVRAPAACGGQPGLARAQRPGATPAADADDRRQSCTCQVCRNGRLEARFQHGAGAIAVCTARIAQRGILRSGPQRFPPKHGLAAPEGGRMMARCWSG